MEKLESFDSWLNKANELQEDRLPGTEADDYAYKNGIDVNFKKGKAASELSSGGPIDSDMIDVIADLEKSTGMDFTITSGNDTFHQNITKYVSNHTTGMAIDITSPDLKKSRSKRKELETAIINLVISGKYNKNGNRLGGINEYDAGTELSTGGHFHLSITSASAKRDRKEFKFPLSNIKSYADIRDKVKTGDPIDVSDSPSNDSPSNDSPSSTDTEKSWRYINTKRKRSRYYYKVYDKKNRRFLTAKYKGDMFKVYNRKGKKVGEVFLRGGSIIMNDEDISQTPVGIGFKHLFEIAAKGQVISNGKKDYIVIDGKDKLKINRKGKVKHNYSGEEARNITLIEEEAIRLGVVNPNSIIAILSVIGKETHFIPKNEHSYSGTTAKRLKDVIFKGPLKHLSYDEVHILRNDNVAFYDTVYGNIANANGYHTWNAPAAPGDGYKYRGRGFNQLTFKKSYQKMANTVGMQSIVTNPDSLNDPKLAAEVAVKFLLKRLAQKSIDPNGFDTPRAAILKYAAANAGWGKDPSNAIAHSNKIEPNFSIA